MQLDNRIETLQAPARVTRAEGCRVLPRNAANSAADIAVNVSPGVIVIDSHPQQFTGRAALAVNSGNTLSASSEVYSAIVAYWNPLVSTVFLLVVDGDEALTSAGADAPTDADIEAALPDDSYPYTVLGVVKHARSAGSVITLEEIDHVARSYGVKVADKDAVLAAAHELDVVDGDRALYRPWGILRFVVDAANIADGDLLTDHPLPLIYGRIPRWRAVCEKAITTAAKTTTPHLEIGSTLVTGTDGTAYAATKALGVCTTLGAPSAANTFVPGDVFSIVAASTTAFLEGRVAFEIEIDELIT